MRLEELSLIGNCQISALVRRDGAVVWSCMPRFDAPPVFGALLDSEAGGHFTIGPSDKAPGRQRYLENTNVLETIFEGDDGSFRVLDFSPRFIQHDRTFRPTKIIRIVEPLTGTPRIRVDCEPILGWSKDRPKRTLGSHHIRYDGYDAELRLTTDAPLAYVGGEPFALTEKKHFVLTWGNPVEEPLEPLCDRFLSETLRYWRQWVKHCEVPTMYQDEVIRSALALKLHCFEDTGAIVAALTTSIPEAPGSGRTWDYRYCWLRDAYYTLGAFRLVGHFEEREQFLSFLLNIAAGAPDLDLAPLYRIDGKSNLEESTLPSWRGYRNEQPVRIGNSAATHQQHDVFGEMVLALTPLFLDSRFKEQASPTVLNLMNRLAKKAISVAGKPDAGIWEYRSEWRPQTFSSIMCWAAADRLAQISARHQPLMVAHFADAANSIREQILANATHPTGGYLVADYGGTELDAALLQAIALGLLPASDARMHLTMDAISSTLASDGWLRRYRIDDGFGTPQVAFMLCTFWQIESLAKLGRLGDARALMSEVAGTLTPLGLLSEDIDPKQKTMWGNFPQAYSHAGLIHAACAVSPRWSEYGL